VAEPVKSSSFVLVNEYHGRLKVYHADLFRLNDPGEIVDLALEETSADGVLLIEWPDRAWQEMAPERLLVRFHIIDPRRRRIEMEAGGARYESLLEELTAGQPARPRRS
jgi:tRNA threonylcarbamoyladenosine biosynthesis protein TsaE